MKLILASNSPRRKMLLSQMGKDFVVVAPTFDEKLESAEFEYKKIESLALNKARSVFENGYENFVVVGADTVVVNEGKILGKPKNEKEAKQMLRALSGKTHFVVTSVAVVAPDFCEVLSDTTEVTFKNLSDDEIDFYVDNFKPLDKAGAYGIQELPEGFVVHVNGNFDNVIGLPCGVLKSIFDGLSDCFKSEISF